MKILQNVFILYVVFLISLLNIGWFIYYNNYNSLIAFITCCLIVYLINHNMIVVLGVSMILVNTLSMFNLVKIINKDGFKEGNTADPNLIHGVKTIRIENYNQPNRSYIQIAELAAYNTAGHNVAYRKPTKASGNWPGYDPWKGVDGRWNSFHTAPTIRETDYWEVDLGTEHTLTRIVYYNRNECCRERIIGQTMILYNRDRQVIKRFQFTNSDLVQTFGVYTQHDLDNKVKARDADIFNTIPV
jgi:hypothetical protein